MSSDSILMLILGVAGGVGGVVLLGWFKGRRSGGKVTAGSVERAKVAHESIDEALKSTTAEINDDREADHAGARERWRRP